MRPPFSPERMEQFKLLCEVRQILAPVTLRTPDALMPGHVLNLTYVISLKPVHQHTCSQLSAVFYLWVDPLNDFQYLTDQVARLLRWEQIS